MSQTPFVVIETCSDLTEAQIKKGLLEQNNIPTLIEDENFNSVYPIFGASKGIGLKVHEDHVSTAHQVLASFANVEPLHPEANPSTEECPACGSAEVFQYRSFLQWLVGRSRPDIAGKYRRCVICDHRWRAGNARDNMFLVAVVLGLAAYILVRALLWLIDFLRYL